MRDRSLLIVFLLAIGGILAYQMFYYAPRMREFEENRRAEFAEQRSLAVADSLRRAARRPPETVVDTLASAPRSSSAARRDPSLVTGTPTAELPEASADLARYITVATPLFEVTFSTKGAEIVSVRLLEYETAKQPVELIAWDTDSLSGLGNLSLVGEDKTLSLTGVAFDAFVQSTSPLADGARVVVGETTPERTLTFRAETPSGQRIERTFVFASDSYVVRSRVRFAEAHFSFARRIEWGFGSGLRTTETHEREDYEGFRASLRLGDEYHKKKLGNFVENFSGTVEWASLKTRYFTTIFFPETVTGGEAQIKSVKDPNFLTASIVLPAGSQRGTIEQTVDIYMGPLDFDLLKAIGRGAERNVDVGFESFKIFKPVSIAILWSMVQLYKVIPNYGIVIIIISIITKILFYRLTHKSFKSMRDMQALQPKLQGIKEKYGDDKQKMSQETMRIYKEAGVNPLGGCLPMVLQMPVFIALFNVLRNTIEVRQAPFFGWISDLAQQDVLFTMPFSLPVLGTAFSVLPILMGASMFAQSKIGGSITGPSSAAQPKALIYMLPILFTVLFYKMPSGLVIYWLVNTVLSVAQQHYINKGAQKEEAVKAANDKNGQTETKKPATKPAAKQKKGPKQKSSKRKN